MKPSTRRVLDALRAGPQTTHSLCQPDVGGLRFGARLLELREQGFVVREERLSLPTRGSRYTLLSGPGVEQASSRTNQEPQGSGAASSLVEAAPAEPPSGLFDSSVFVRSLGYGDSEAA